MMQDTIVLSIRSSGKAWWRLPGHLWIQFLIASTGSVEPMLTGSWVLLGQPLVFWTHASQWKTGGERIWSPLVDIIKLFLNLGSYPEGPKEAVIVPI